MVSWIWPRTSAITFDLGGAGIRALQLRQRAGGPRLCDALRVDRAPSADERRLPEGEPLPAAERELRRRPGLNVEPALLDRLIGQGRFNGRRVALILSPPEVRFFPMRLPEAALQQSPERVQQALKWEAARESRLSAEDLEVRHWCLPAAGGQASNVMAVVMSARQAREWCERFEQQRLVLERIDVSPCALVRLAQWAWTPADNDVWGVLDLGYRHSTLTVVVGTVPTYVRTLTVTTQRWTELVAAAFEVVPAVAEQLKREHGVNAEGTRAVAAPADGRSLLRAADLPSALASVLRESLQTLTTEVERCFAYVLQSYPEYNARRLWVAGGGARMSGLALLLASELGIPVEVLAAGGPGGGAWEHPLADVAIEPDVAAAIGGALLGLECT